MKTTPYAKIPAKNQWKNDSQIVDQQKKAPIPRDAVLRRIDDLLGRIPSAKDGGELKYLECELFFATNFWLNNYRATTQMRREREPAVRMLRQFIETDLAKTLKCPPQMLRPKLHKHFVKPLNAHGVFLDRGGDIELTLARRNKHRISFEDGRAYWLQWWNFSGCATTLELVNTSIAFEHTVDALDVLTSEDWGNFVMGFDREIYIGAHRTTTAKGRLAKYHSSYLAGMPVQFAGSIKIVEGVVLGVRNNSGHYKPGDKYFINILAHLKTVGVDIKNVKLLDFKGDDIENDKGEPYRADRYLADNGRWETVLKRKKQYLVDRAELGTAIGRKLIYQRVYPGNVHKSKDTQPDKVTNENLHKLAEEQYNMAIKKGKSRGHALWRETWKRICNAIADFLPSARGEAKFQGQWRKRALKPGPPPIPRKGPR